MKVQVKYFATLRDRAGVKQQALDFEDGLTVAELRRRLSASNERLSEALGSALIAVNQEYAFGEEVLQDGDEIALFPPVSGGAGPRTRIALTEAEFDLNQIVADLVLPTTGAVCAFTGVVRGETSRDQAHKTDHLEYEAYQQMAEAKMRQVADEIRERWAHVEGIAIVQRLGILQAGTPTVLIACATPHRDQGVFEAARYGIDRLKEIVPIWKKEVGPDGEAWVEGEYVPGPSDLAS